MTEADLPRQALYMIWDTDAPRMPAPIAVGYEIEVVGPEMADAYRRVVELDGALRDAQWKEFVELLLPGGMFIARTADSGEAIGTVSVINNPSGARFYFPGGGAIAYLVVGAQHRGRGIGHALVKAAIDRLRSSGYRNIWVAVEETRMPAIKTYLDAGFVPFLHPPTPDVLESRWLEAFARLGRQPSAWPRALPSSSTSRELLRAPANEAEWNAYHAIRRRVLFEIRGLGATYDANHPDEHAPGHHPLVFWDGFTAVGVIRVDFAGDVAVFRRVAVREELQRQGYGRRLLRAAEQFARAQGCLRVDSHVDPGAIGFYERCGFVRSAGAVMTKSLAD